MQNVRAKIIDFAPFAPGSEAVRVTAAPAVIAGGKVTFDAENPVEAVYVPMAWNQPGEVIEFAEASDMVSDVGLMVFSDVDNATGVIPPEVPSTATILEFFLVGR